MSYFNRLMGLSGFDISPTTTPADKTMVDTEIQYNHSSGIPTTGGTVWWEDVGKSAETFITSDNNKNLIYLIAGIVIIYYVVR
ncbi:hypothetical protein ES702_04963 [subsurface metagenome]